MFKIHIIDEQQPKESQNYSFRVSNLKMFSAFITKLVFGEEL